MLHKARLISHDTKDGWDYIRDEIPLGKIYYVDVDSITTMQCGQIENPGVWVERALIRAYNTSEGGDGGWMPLELLKIEPNA